jgi:hypothetical protein
VNKRRNSFNLSFGGRLLVSITFGLAISAIAYAAVRVLDVLLFPEPNPVVVIWTDRSRFIWRVIIATYLGGAGAFGGYSLALRNPENAFAWMENVILFAGGCLLLQAVLAP